jgi:hypothetical protein
MSTSARRRLLRDFRRLQGDPPSGVTGAPMDTNIMLWQAVIFGPDDTPWEGGTFKLVLEFTEDYPNKAPSVRFLTKMFHPNICECFYHYFVFELDVVVVVAECISLGGADVLLQSFFGIDLSLFLSFSLSLFLPCV